MRRTRTHVSIRGASWRGCAGLNEPCLKLRACDFVESAPKCGCSYDFQRKRRQHVTDVEGCACTQVQLYRYASTWFAIAMLGLHFRNWRPIQWCRSLSLSIEAGFLLRGSLRTVNSVTRADGSAKRSF